MVEIIHRLPLDFSEEAWKKLDNLRIKFGFPNHAETIRNALAVLNWIHEKAVVESRDIVAIGKDDSVVELLNLCFLFSQKSNETRNIP